MHPLVAKFEKIKVTQESLLPAEDIQHCELHQSRLNENLKQLKAWSVLLNGIQSKEANSAYELDKYDWKDEQHVNKTYNYRTRVDDPEINIYDQFKFTVLYNIVAVTKLIKKSKYFFMNSLYVYFRDKYNIDLETPDTDEDKRDFTDYKVIIDDIRIQLGGHLDFNIVALDKAIKAFKTQIYFASRVELKGKNITLVDYMRYDTNYGTGAAKFHSEGKYLTCLDHAISIFEREEVIDRFAFGSNMTGDDVDFTKDYPVLNGSRVESFRFYKNRKVIIKFVDIQSAKDFYNRLSLSVF